VRRMVTLVPPPQYSLHYINTELIDLFSPLYKTLHEMPNI
jgi:hypothetical protein